MAKQNDPTDPTEQEALDNALPEPSFPPIGEVEDDEGEQGDGSSLEERLAALEAAREEERKQFDSERQRWQTTVDRLLQSQAAPAQSHPPAQPAPQQPAQPQMPEVNLNGMPDPVDRPQEYQQELARRVNYAMQQQSQAVRQQFEQFQQETQQATSQEQQLNQLWDRFKSEYSDLADKQITLNGAVSAEMQGMKQRGVDPMRGALADPDGFLQNVANRMRRELGTPNGGGEGLQPPPNRTKGLGNGTKVNGNVAGKGEKSPGFLAQLKKAQLDSGLI